MQDNLRAKTLLTIAGALALLTASIVVLSGIDSKKMASALGGLTAMFIQLMGALAIFNKISATGMYLKLPVVAAGLLILAGALVILSSAVEKMSDLEWEGLLKGLTGVTALLAVMAGVTQIMKTRMGGMITTAIGMVILASAVRILYGAVENFSGLSWADMAKGLTGVAAVLLALSLFSHFSKASLKAVPQAIGIAILASAIKILYTAVRDFATMKWEEIGRGLAAMAGALGILAIAMQFISGSSILGGVGLVIVSASLLILADALQKMGKMSWGEIGRSLTLMLGAMTIIAAAMWAMIEALPGALAMIIIAPALVILADALERFGEMEWAEIGKALTLLAGSLAAIALAMMGMTGAVPGALALIVVAGALSILAPILKLFGGMEWDEIGKGLVALAGVLGVIAVTSLLLSPAIPLIAGLGIAIGILGVAVLAAGAGVLAFAIALGMLASSGAAGMNFLIDTVDRLIDLIPKAMEKFGEGVVKFAEVIEDGAPAIGGAMTAIFEEMIRTFDRIAPLVVETMAELVVRIAEAMADRADRLADAAVTLVTTFLETMAEEAPRMAEAGYKLVVALAGSILFYAWKFVDKAGLMIALFIAAIARSVDRRAPQIRRAGRKLATAIIDGITGGLFSRFAQSRVVQAAVNLARRAVNAAKNALGIASPSKVFREIGEFAGEGLAIGITDTQREVGLSAEELGDSATMRLQRAMANLPDALDGIDWDAEPTITPVMDLSKVTKDADAISKMLSVTEVKASANYSQARGIVAAEDARRSAQEALGGEEREAVTINYEQNNYSPKELSTEEIYRRTKNQISLLRKGVSASDNRL